MPSTARRSAMPALAEVDLAHAPICPDFLRRALHQDRALDQDGDALGEPEHEVHVVLDEEDDMNLVFRFAERITVLVEGSILVEGTTQEIGADRRVREVYLGEGGHG